MLPSAARFPPTFCALLCPDSAPKDGTRGDGMGATCPKDFLGLVGKSASSLVSVRSLHMGSTPGASTFLIIFREFPSGAHFVAPWCRKRRRLRSDFPSTTATRDPDSLARAADATLYVGARNGVLRLT